MEGLALILIGTAIFTHSWHLLGLYADGRTVGVLMSGLAAAVVVTLFALQPQFLGTVSEGATLREGETAVLISLTLAWGIYMFAVAAQGFWDLEERAIGFFGILLTVISVISVMFYAQIWITTESILMLPLVIAGSLLAITGALLFFLMAIPFPGFRPVSGWVMLLESIVIAGIGMAMISTVIA